MASYFEPQAVKAQLPEYLDGEFTRYRPMSNNERVPTKNMPPAWILDRTLHAEPYPYVMPQGLRSNLGRHLLGNDNLNIEEGFRTSNTFECCVVASTGTRCGWGSHDMDRSFLEETAKGGDRMSVKLEGPTNMPHITFIGRKTVEGVDKFVRLRIFANQQWKFVRLVGRQEIYTRGLVNFVPKHMQPLLETGALIGIWIDIGDQPARDGLHVSAGINPNDYYTDESQWKQELELRYQGKGRLNHQFENLFADMHFVGGQYLILRGPPSPQVQDKLRREWTVWCDVATLAIQHGPFWWYRMQPGFSNIPGHHFDYWKDERNPIPIPPWMVTLWQVESHAGYVESIRPLEWADHILNGSELIQVGYPDWQTRALMTELCARQENAWSMRLALMLFGPKTTTHTITVEPLGANKRVMMGKIWTNTSHLPTDERNLVGVYQPKDGTKLRLTINLPTGNGGYREVKAEGYTEEAKTSEGYVCHVVCQCEKQSGGMTWPSAPTTCQATIEVGDQGISSKRGLDALANLCNGIERENGVDLLHLLFGKPSGASPEQRNWFGTEFIRTHPNCSKTEEQDSISQKLMRGGFQPNEVQSKTLRSSFEDSTTIIQGPPGTGKTQTAAASVMANVLGGVKVAVATPSNPAADEVLRKILAFARSIGEQPKIVRFITSGDSTSQSDDGDAAENPTDAPASFMGLVMQFTDPVLKKTAFRTYSYPQKKVDWITEKRNSVADTEAAKKLKADCEAWNTLKNKVVNAKGNKLDKEGRNEFRRLNTRLGALFLGEQDIVIGTLNSFGHHEASGFEPTVLLVDEAAQATDFDISIPLSTYKESIMKLTLCGDHKQLGPVITSRGTANCARNMAARTLFERLWNAGAMGSLQVKTFVLNIQYRAEASLAFPSQEFQYKDVHITNHPCTNVQCPATLAVEDWLHSKLGGKYNGGRLILIDTSGPQVHSKLYKGSPSTMNEAEVNVMHYLAQELVRALGPNSSEQFRVVVPYAGQRRAIHDLRRAKAAGPQADQELEYSIYSVIQSQGQEWEIQASSFVANDARDKFRIGFVNDARNLNVQMSRPKRYHICCAAWRQYMHPTILGAMLKDRRTDKFAQLVKILKEANYKIYTPEDLGMPPTWKDVDVTHLEENHVNTGAGWKACLEAVDKDKKQLHQPKGKAKARGKGKGKKVEKPANDSEMMDVSPRDDT